ADPVRRRRRQRGGDGGDLRVDPVRVPRGRLPAGGVARRRRTGAADDRWRDRSRQAARGVLMPVGVRLLPNAVTVVALCSGLSAGYFALLGRFEPGVAAPGVAAVCDALDGRLARMLDASRRIGAELDSLSDLVSFGVAP